MATRQREEAIKRYYENPNKCSMCNKIIEIPTNGKVTRIRHKKFCDHKCAMLYKKQKPKIKHCAKCSQLLESKYGKYCSSCRWRNAYQISGNSISSDDLNSIGNMTKQELFTKNKNWQSARSSLRRHAAKVFCLFGGIKHCIVCGYSVHVEICHIESVKNFSKDVLISEINRFDNLVALCRNHHWEFDNNILTKEEIITLK